ncbi:hypothetical protein ACF0H5_007400 [Mactra antiquata]
MSAKRMGKKQKSRVSFVEEPPKTKLDVIRTELDQMRRRDEEKTRRYEDKKQHELDLMKAKMAEERKEKGLQLYPDSRLSKREIKDMLKLEEKNLRQEERMKVATETQQMKNEISIKHGTHVKKKPPDMMKLAEEFASSNQKTNTLGLPERIVKELTIEEIMDLKMIFDLYDVAGGGYVSKKAVKKLTAVLGFRMSNSEIQSRLDKLVKDPGGKVTFITFLDFIIQSQEGSDPFEECTQCFRILDRDGKGYVTFDDLRVVADEVGCKLSNRQIQEMLDEADKSGNAEVELEEFIIMMLRTTAFNFS